MSEKQLCFLSYQIEKLAAGLACLQEEQRGLFDLILKKIDNIERPPVTISFTSTQVIIDTINNNVPIDLASIVSGDSRQILIDLLNDNNSKCFDVVLNGTTVRVTTIEDFPITETTDFFYNSLVNIPEETSVTIVVIPNCGT